MADEYLSYIQEHHPDALKTIQFRLKCGFTVDSIKDRFPYGYPSRNDDSIIYFHDLEVDHITQELCYPYFQIRNLDLSFSEFLIQLDFTSEAAQKHTELILSIRPQIIKEEYIFAIFFLIDYLYLLEYQEKEFTLPENLLNVGRERYSGGCYKFL